jgi:CTP:molybdopterin cytidylyltransferase MocA
MTVGAVIVPAGLDEALVNASGRIAVRRIVDAAWAGGALPIVVVVADDAEGSVSAALAGSPALCVDPGTQVGPSAYAVGALAALEAVRETSALLLWPGRMTWVDPETVTSLIEAHGYSPARLLRPERAGQVGWPVLVPAGQVTQVLVGTAPATVESRLTAHVIGRVELGDPGSILGNEVTLDEMPDYAGPPEPVGGPPPEWGAAAAETPDPEVTPRA